MQSRVQRLKQMVYQRGEILRGIYQEQAKALKGAKPDFPSEQPQSLVSEFPKFSEMELNELTEVLIQKEHSIAVFESLLAMQEELILGLKKENEILGNKLFKQASTLEKVNSDLNRTFFYNSIGREIPTCSPSAANDLKQIIGVGYFIESRLNELGIYSYRQIASMNSLLAEKLSLILFMVPHKINKEDWIGQAKELLKSNKVAA
jgi:hypothetical protein